MDDSSAGVGAGIIHKADTKEPGRKGGFLPGSTAVAERLRAQGAMP